MDFGPADISNFESKKIAERYFEFTYHFTEDYFHQADICE